MTNKPNFFIAGCQKTGSTWLYRAFQEHPKVYVPVKDALHYFTINHFLGQEWYEKWYLGVKEETVICDPTPSYIRDPHAAKRIYDFNPKAKLLFTLRNPIERSFSHYWHQKRSGKILFNFKDTFHYNGVGNYDLFEIWVKSSEYTSLLTRYYEWFPRDQILITLFDDLKNNPQDYLDRILHFVGLHDQFIPSIIKQRVNAARRKNREEKRSFRKHLSNVKSMFLKDNDSLKNEYEAGIEEEFRQMLSNYFGPEIDELSRLINRDLSFWKN